VLNSKWNRYDGRDCCSSRRGGQRRLSISIKDKCNRQVINGKLRGNNIFKPLRRKKGKF
jgi:hypothetical protein